MLNPNDVLSHISFLLVFLEGLLSFLSPCVLPLLPVYMGYLAGQDQEQPHSQRRIFLLTVSFVIGIFTAILLMNISVHVLSSFFKDHMVYFRTNRGYPDCASWPASAGNLEIQKSGAHMEAAASEKRKCECSYCLSDGLYIQLCLDTVYRPCAVFHFAAGVILRQSLGVHLPDDCICTGVYNSLPDIGIVYRKGTALDFQS